LGQFLSEDPIGFGAADPNLRRYVRNSSPNATDPTGLRDWNRGLLRQLAQRDLEDIRWLSGQIGLLEHYLASGEDSGGDSLTPLQRRIYENRLDALFDRLNPVLDSYEKSLVKLAESDEIEELNGRRRLKDFAGQLREELGNLGTHVATGLAEEAAWAAAGFGAGKLLGFAGEKISDYVKARRAAKLAGELGDCFQHLVEQLSLSDAAQRKLLRDALGQPGTGKVAHHLIPLEALHKFRQLFERGARAGFDLNGRRNGRLLLDRIEHYGGHLGYNRAVLEQIANLDSQARQLSDVDIAEALYDIADTLGTAIDKGDFFPDF